MNIQIDSVNEMRITHRVILLQSSINNSTKRTVKMLCNLKLVFYISLYYTKYYRSNILIYVHFKALDIQIIQEELAKIIPLFIFK